MGLPPCGALAFADTSSVATDRSCRPMDSFELNKIAGAVLGTLLFVMGLNIVAGIVFTPHRPAVPGYDLPSAEEATGGGEAAPQAPAVPLPQLLAQADPARGEKAVAKCKACHTFEKGGPNKVGPHLWDVVDRQIAEVSDFSYSATLKEHGANGEKWTYEHLDEFIANPRGYMKGTIMAFAGVS